MERFGESEFMEMRENPTREISHHFKEEDLERSMLFCDSSQNF
jgi:hypothetical protein